MSQMYWQLLQRGRRYFEEYAYILDIIPTSALDFQRIRTYKLQGYDYIVHALGEQYFTLLELTPKVGKEIKVREKVFIGKGYRDKIERIVRRITYDELSQEAKDLIPSIVEEIVSNKEQYFVDFFNRAGPITPRLHSLELLRGIGKKTLWDILNERKKEPFKSFEDIKNRTGIDAKKVIVERIIEELKGGQKYYLFVAPPSTQQGTT